MGTPEWNSGRLANFARLSNEFLVAPPHLPSEVVSAIYRRYRAADLTEFEAEEAIVTLAELPIELLYPPNLPVQALAIARELNLSTTYDAFYIALSEILGCEV